MAVLARAVTSGSRMFLRSLVVRGFKSFADKTTLVFEPGITIVVGPNGSGKSNIVDAISWVLGEQGPRSLRGGKMEDVIFAGSRLRPALGMAEVSLTIDNSAGLLPIEFTEVTISRLLFRSGESEYRLNGTLCRLLDIQEVLSDSGIGREQHTIIGQGQIDAVLSADPLEMRGFIEEAAGIAKHRRRKERSLRKIAGTEHNLGRLGDLLAEIRRQLRPLREQADVAKRHAAITDEFSRIRMVMSARELASVRARLGSGESIDFDETMRAKEVELSSLEARLGGAEAGRSTSFTDSERERESAWSLSRSAERLGSMHKLATERQRTLEAELATTTEAAAEARVAELRRQVDETRSSVEDAERHSRSSESELETAKLEREEAARRLRAVKDAIAPVRLAEREASHRLVARRSELAGTSASNEAAARERARIAGHRADVEVRLEASSAGLQSAVTDVTRLESDEQPLAQELEDLEIWMKELQLRRLAAGADLRVAEKQAALWRARAEVRATATRVPSHVLEIEGVVGLLSDLVEVPEGFRPAVEVLFGSASSVVVVKDSQTARRVLDTYDDGVGVLMPPATAIDPTPEVRRLGPIDAVCNMFVCESVPVACTLSARHPEAIFLTATGAVVVGNLVLRGSAEVALKAGQEEAKIAAIEERLQELNHEISGVQARLDETTKRLNSHDAAINAATERLSSFDREIAALRREAETISISLVEVDRTQAEFFTSAQLLEAEIPRLEAQITGLATELERLREDDVLASVADAAAASALDEARVRHAVAHERKRILEDRMTVLVRALATATGLASGVPGRREGLARAIDRVESVQDAAIVLQREAEGWAKDADEMYRSSREALQQFDLTVSDLRNERAALVGALDEMRVRARQEDLGRSELKIRSRILEERMREEWGVDPEATVGRFGHHWEVEDPSRIEDLEGGVATMDDETLRRRHAKLERDLAEMGRVNPLAGPQFEALTSREEFLASQMADVRASRRDLFKIVNSVDEQIKELFASAYEDVAREYERLFALLFPGGQGRLRLSEPADLLQTGVEVEARPGGKNLKRLSLLSGGERALCGLAVLFAIFRARPSPFYVLDEVEAALDDVNLHRFLGLLKEFRESSQLLVVSHQKRTMEVADVLYGVSIKADGASRVISEKLSEFHPESISEES